MHHEEMLTWLLFYTSLFDLREHAGAGRAGPRRVVLSQAVETEDGAFRLVLNASQSRQTLSSRFLSDLFGSGVQHIALATGDIFATVGRLRENGVSLLPIPENYYDDLAARIDIAEPDLDRLRRDNILYDRQGGGEFLQAYTDNFDRRLLFRDCRAPRLCGFGAPNAPIRLAAQTRRARRAVAAY